MKTAIAFLHAQRGERGGHAIGQIVELRVSQRAFGESLMGRLEVNGRLVGILRGSLFEKDVERMLRIRLEGFWNAFVIELSPRLVHGRSSSRSWMRQSALPGSIAYTRIESQLTNVTFPP